MHASERIQQHEQERSRTTLLLFIKIALATISLFVVTGAFDHNWWKAGGQSIGLIMLATGWFHLNRKQHYQLSLWLYMTAIWLALMAGVFTRGGSNAPYPFFWFCIILGLAGLVGDLRFSMIWAIIIAASITLVLTLEWLGIVIPNITSNTRGQRSFSISLFTLIITMAAMFMGYRRKHQKFELWVALSLAHTRRENIKRRKAEREAKARAQEKLQTLQNLRHEFNTPLNNILGFTKRLNKSFIDTPPTKEVATAIKTLEQQGEKTLIMSDQLWQVDQLISTPPNITRCDLIKLIKSTLSNLGNTPKLANINQLPHTNQHSKTNQLPLKVSFSSLLPQQAIQPNKQTADSFNPEVELDPERFCQALSALIFVCSLQNKASNLKLRLQPEGAAILLDITGEQIISASFAHLDWQPLSLSHPLIAQNSQTLNVIGLELKKALLNIQQQKGHVFVRFAPPSTEVAFRLKMNCEPSNSYYGSGQ